MRGMLKYTDRFKRCWFFEKMQISIEKIFSYLGSLYMKTGKTKGLGDEKNRRQMATTV